MTTQTSPEASEATSIAPDQAEIPRPRFDSKALKPLPSVTQAIPLMIEVVVVAGGSLLLWWGAEGRGVTHGNQLSMTIFIVALTVLMTSRGFVLAMLRTQEKNFPAATRWLMGIRNIALLGLAVYSNNFDDYMGQWIIAFAAIVLASTGLAGLTLAVVRRDSSAEITSRFLDSSAGVLAMAFTQTIHGWDVQFIAVLCSLVLVPAYLAWTITQTVRSD